MLKVCVLIIFDNFDMFIFLTNTFNKLGHEASTNILTD